MNNSYRWYQWNRLTSLTPELSEEERLAMFSKRNMDELAQINMILMEITQKQREIIYDVLRGWIRNYVKLN